MLRSRVLAGLERVRQQGQEARSPQGLTQGRERHQDAPERREGHTEGGGAGRLGSGTVQRVKREMAAEWRRRRN